MWPFLFILALFPLFFFWSDQVLALFPQLEKYLPSKTKTEQQLVGADALKGEDGRSYTSGKWYSPELEQGYVAWSLSDDGQYRLAVGCRAAAEAALQVTKVDRTPLPDDLVLNFQYGELGLTTGSFSGPALVSSVAQFSGISVQAPPEAGSGVLATFVLSPSESGLIARALEQNCGAAEQ